MMCGEISGLGKRLPLENSRFEGVLPKTPVLQRGSGEAPGPSGSPTYEVMKCSYRRGNSSAKNGIAEGNNPALSRCSREGKCPSGTCNRRIAWQDLQPHPPTLLTLVWPPLGHPFQI